MYYYPYQYPPYYVDPRSYYPYYPPPPEPWFQNPPQILPQQLQIKMEQSDPKNAVQTFKAEKIKEEEKPVEQEEQEKEEPQVESPKKGNNRKQKKKILWNPLKLPKEDCFQNPKKAKLQVKEKTEKKKKAQKMTQEDLATQKELSFLANLKKNTESNIVNQIFSYVGCRIKSGKYIEKLLDNDVRKIKSYYEFLKTIKKRKKKYINRRFLLELCILDSEHHAGFKLYMRQKGAKNFITKDELKSVLRKMFVFYLNSQCILSIATSKKLSPEAWSEHLYRRRQILFYLDYHIKEREKLQ